MNLMKRIQHWRNRIDFEHTFAVSWEARPEKIEVHIMDVLIDLISDYRHAKRALADISKWDKSQAKALIDMKDTALNHAVSMARARGFHILLNEDKTRIIGFIRPEK